jgi:hypothetical protein
MMIKNNQKMPNTYNIDGEILFNESVRLKGWKYGKNYEY